MTLFKHRIYSNRRFVAAFLAIVGCSLVESRRHAESIFGLVAHSATARKAPRDKKTARRAVEEKEEEVQPYSNIFSIDRGLQPVVRNPPIPDSDLQLSRRFKASDLFRRFRIPVLLLLHLVYQTGIAEARHHPNARLFRVGMLHIVFQTYLAVAEKLSSAVVGLLMLLFWLFSMFEHIESQYFQAILYGGIFSWLSVMLVRGTEKLNDGKLVLRLSFGSAFVLLCMIPQFVALEQYKTILGALALFLYFDLSTEFLTQLDTADNKQI